MSQSGKSHGVAVLQGSYVALCSALLFVMEVPVQAQSALTHHVPQGVISRQAQFQSPLPATHSLHLDIVLPLRDRAALHNLLRELGDPSSPSYRHFLTVPEFTAQFGPSEEDYDALTLYATSNGFQVVGGSRDGMDLQIEGPVTAIEQAFHVSMGVYQHPMENRTFYSPDREPTVGLPFTLWHISGLDNYSIPHSMLVRKSDYAKAHGIDPETVVSHATTGSGPSASFLGSDMRAAYYGGTTLTGAGQNLGLLEYQGADLTDLATYFNNAGQINTVPVTLLSTDGTSTSCVYSSGCDDTEQIIDLTQAIGMAPGLSSLVVYIGSSDTAIISAMTSHNPLPTTIGCSWTWTAVDPSTLDPYFQRMAAQGQNFFAASGDTSTWSPANEPWPADDAYVVSVGGTDLITAGAGGPWKSETAWIGSGGGISPNGIAIPSWQQISGVINSSNQGSTTYRNGPDVSANANFTFYVCADQTACTANQYGGTSFAAPMWAGYMALVNQQAIANGNATLGFINPAIYSFGVGSGYISDFHDICNGTSGNYSAVAGYDLVTGWGSPNGTGLIDALANTVNGKPDFTLSASSACIGAIAGNSVGLTLTISALNAFSGAVSLTASGMPAGVTASFAPASVTGSGTSIVTFTTASSTAPGTYPIAIQAVSGSLTHTAAVSLTVSVPDFTLSASPTAVVLPPSGSATSTITVGALNGFSGSVSLTANGLPAGVTGSFSQPIVNNGSGSTTLTLLSASAPAGVFTVTVQGANGNLLHTAPLTVTLQPSFLLPANVSVLPGSSISYPVTLTAPAASTVFVSLTSSDSTKLTVTPANVLIQAGSTAPSTPPRLTGVSFATVSITASAWNYAPATQPVQVADSLNFFPTSLTLSQGATQNLTLTLAAALPSALKVILSSANAAVATLPATVTFPANGTSVTLPVTGVGVGSTIIHASALPAVPDTTAAITVGPGLAILTAALNSGQVNSAYSQTLVATGGTPPLTWTLISGALPTGLTLSPAGQISGTPTVTVTNTPLTFKVTDTGSPPQTASITLTLTIAPSGPSPASITAAKGTPQSATVNTAFTVPLTALVKDSGGNPLSGVMVSFTAPSTGATGTFATGASATIVTDATGSASASFTANALAGAYTVNASVPGVASPAPFLLTNLAGPPAHLSATSGNAQSTGINTAFSGALAATVTDGSGNPVSGVKVTFTAPVTGASGSFAGGTNTATTGLSGLATSPAFTANGTPGSYSVTASVAGVTALASFSLTNIGPAASVIAVSGSGQSASIGTPFPSPLVVKVQDAVGDPVSGVTVSFAAPSTGASGVFNGSSMVVTNASGIATTPTFTANAIGGTYQVSATAAGVANPVTFSLTNLSGIVLPAGVTVAPGLSAPYPVALGAPAPAGGVFIALTSSNTSTITVTPLNILVPAGSTTPTVMPKVNGINLGSATITASAWTYQPVSQQVTVTDGLNFYPSSVTISAGGSQYVTLTLLAPVPASLPVSLTSSNAAVATAPPTATFPANSTSLTVRLTGLATGSATITASSPPNVTPASISVTVR